jgi:hypothetical protein
MRCDSGTSAALPRGANGYDVEGKDSRWARWCSLACINVSQLSQRSEGYRVGFRSSS